MEGTLWKVFVAEHLNGTFPLMRDISSRCSVMVNIWNDFYKRIISTRERTKIVVAINE